MNEHLFGDLPKYDHSFMTIDLESSRIFTPGQLEITEKILAVPVEIPLLLEKTCSADEMTAQLDNIKNAVFKLPFAENLFTLICKCSDLAHKKWTMDYIK